MARQYRETAAVRHCRNIKLFGVVTIFIVGCSYEPEHIPFEPFVSQEQIESGIKDIEIQLQNDPNDHELLVQYGILLSKRLQYKITHARKYWKSWDKLYTNKYQDFYRINSIVENCYVNKIFDKTLFENHIRNLLLFVEPSDYDTKNLDRIKRLSDQLLAVDGDSKTATIGLAYYYSRINDKDNFSSQIAKIQQWRQLSAAALYINSLALEEIGAPRSILAAYMFKNGMSSRDDYFLLWRDLLSRYYPSTMSLEKYFYPRWELGNRFQSELSNLKQISFPFLLSIAPFVNAQLSAINDGEYFFEKYCLGPATELAEEDPKSRNDILGEIISTYAMSGAYRKTVDWIQKIPESNNPKVLRFPDMNVDDRALEYAKQQAHLSVEQQLMLSSWKIYQFNLSRENQNDLRHWIRNADSLRESVGKKDSWISSYEIAVLSELCAKQNYEDRELVKRTWQSIKTYFKETGVWTGSRFLMGLTSSGKNTEMRNCLSEIMNQSPRGKESLYSFFSNGPSLGEWDILLLIALRNMKLLDRKMENTAAFYTIWRNIDYGNVQKSIAYLRENEDVLEKVDEFKRANYYGTLRSLCYPDSQWQSMLYLEDKLSEMESVKLPKALVEKAYCLFKLGRKMESDGIFAAIEQKAPSYDYQFMARAKILVEIKRTAEAEQLVNEKVRDIEDRKAFWKSISKQ